MNAEGCHRCGRHSHKAVCCVQEMPKEVKDWCLNHTYDSAYLSRDSSGSHTHEQVHYTEDHVYFQPDLEEGEYTSDFSA
ncbi:hypothetical protein C8R42DRAFT_653331 [Lentinula raphanica]|nr:hypothetical protein C8R42DRAFT_653331 [Lentinula raphanica]